MWKTSGLVFGVVGILAACGSVEGESSDAAVNMIDAAISTIDADPNAPDANPNAPDANNTPDAMPLPDGAVCGAGSTCVAAAPASWNGPVGVYEGASGSPPPTCPAAYPTLDHTLNTGLQAGGACSCDCDDPTGFSCGSARVTQHQGDATSTCISFNPPTFNATSTCTTRTISSTTPWQRASMPAPTGGQCAPRTIDNLQTPTWTNTTRACSNAAITAGGCSGSQVCAPNPDASFTKICVWSAGDNACPGGSPYSQRTVHYAGFTDNRSCGGCTCGDVEGSCSGNVHYQSDCSALPLLLDSVGPGVCKKVTARTYGIRYSANPQVSCQASSGTESGAATPDDSGAVTFCCLP